nr:MAG TPA: hypothetical protein [Caudoviricetes sp.]
MSSPSTIPIIPRKEEEQRVNHNEKKAPRISSRGTNSGWICQPWNGVNCGPVFTRDNRAA